MNDPVVVFAVGLLVTVMVAAGYVVTYREFHRMSKTLETWEKEGKAVRRKLDGTPYA